jgi:SPP1 family predicted phage head-tail adaptor
MTLPGPRVAISFYNNEGTVPDGMGGIKESWVLMFSTTCVVGTTKAKETIEAGEDTTTSTLVFFVDYNATTTGTLTIRDQAVAGGVTYRIEYIRNPCLISEHLEIRVIAVEQ